MSRYGPDFFRELLVADLAIEKGADPERVGSAMARFLDTGDREELDDIGSSVAVELEAALSKANGDAKVALASRGGLDRSMLQSVPALTSSGVRARAELRSLDPARYVDLQEIGRGGMGVVYLAFDTDLNRHVALKFVRTGADADPLSDVLFADPTEGHTRFLQEAWVTGGLEHPGVVPVYELGKTESGAPYYAMRVIRGERTLEDAILQARGLEDRLALVEPFLKICDTVRYAHGRGVIHRDLKPSNVALGEYGEVVLLDWGLAKVKEHPDFAESRWHDRLQEMRAETNLQTLEGAVGTPGFMALEALTGELDRVDERSDVYSLGVTLYRVLTGEMPYGQVGLGELYKRMLAGLPPSPRLVDPAIPEGLVRICMKALATDRERRYGDAGQLADAVRRWQRESALDREVGAMLSEAESGLTATQTLEGDALLSQVDRVLAVTARILELKPEQAEAKRIEAEARKRRATAMEANAHATRRRLLVRVGAAGLAAAAAIAVIVAVLLDAKRREADDARGREQVARVRAETERGRAEDLSAFMLVELREKLEPLGRLDLLGSVARKSLDYQRSLPARELTAKDWRARGLALVSLGDVLVESGDPASALQCYEDALSIQRRHAADHPAEPAWQRAVAVSLERITDVRIQQGDLDVALAASGESLEIKRRLASGSSDAESRQDLAVGLDKLGYVKVLHGDLDAAQAAYEEGLEIRERLVAERPDEALLQRDLSVSLNELGAVRWRRRDYAAALSNYVRSVKIRRRLIAADDANAGLQRDLFVSLVRLGRAQLQLEETAGAQASGREALRVSQHLAEADPTNTRWQQDVSLARELVGDAQAAGGDLDGALRSLRESLAIRERLAAADPTNVERQRNLAVNHDSIGKLHGLREDASAALTSFERSFDITERIAKQDPSNLNLQRDLYVTLASMAGAHEVAGDLEQAVRALQQSVDRCRTLVAEAPHLRRELDMLAKEHRKLVLLAALKAPEGPADHLVLGRALYDRKEFAQAAEHFAEALGDEALRTDLNEGALYDAACTAALAGTEAWRNRALGWLAEDVRLRRKRIDEVTAELGQDPSKERRTQLEALRAQSVRQLEHARAKDPDLATLRGTEAFERIFDPSRR